MSTSGASTRGEDDTDDTLVDDLKAVVEAADDSLVHIVTINKAEELRAALVDLGMLS